MKGDMNHEALLVLISDLYTQLVGLQQELARFREAAATLDGADSPNS